MALYLNLSPEHGFYGVEQDMVAAADGRDPLTGLPVVSLYGDTPESLRPEPGWHPEQSRTQAKAD